MNNWPTQADVLSGKSVYGDPRSRTAGVGSAAWEAAQLVYVKAPFRMTYAGQIMGRGMKVHRYCAPSLGRVMTNLMDAAGGKQDVLDHWGVSVYGGGHNFRLMRGGAKLSMHSYGCAVDLDPANNGLGDQTPRFASFPEVQAAWAAEQWTWGGKWARADGMHWQATTN